jgi:cation transport ATPase
MTAKAGILTSGGGEAFQTTTNVSHVVLDKTGTITTGGSMLVTDVDWVEGGSSSSKASRNEILAAIRVAEAESSHPIGTALRAFAAEHLGEEPHAIQVVHIKEVPGRGLVATFSSAAGDPAPQFDLWLGNTEHMLDAGIPITADTSAMALQAEWEAAAKTVITVAICVPEHTPCVVARVAVADPPRKEAREVIKELRKGYQVWMLSGDSLPTALAVARQVGIADDHVIAGVLPEAKADHLEALQNRTHELVPRGNWSTLVHRAGIVKGRKRGVVMFVGGA